MRTQVSLHPAMKCHTAGCTYDTDEEIPKESDNREKIDLLQLHQAAHPAQVQGGGRPPDNTAKRDRLRRPTVDTDSTEACWSEFQVDWQHYKTGCGIKGADDCRIELLQCCEKELKSSLFRNTGGEYDSLTEEQLLGEMKQLAVRAQNPLVNRVVLLGMQQAEQEGIRTFVARMKGQANTCKLTTECVHCHRQVPYMDEMVRCQMIQGLADNDIRDLVLGEPEKSLDDTVKFVEGKESGKSSNRLMSGVTPTVNKITPFQKLKFTKDSEEESSTKEKCSNCGLRGHGSREEDRRKHCRAYKETCARCKKVGHYKRCCRSKKEVKEVAEDTAESNEVGNWLDQHEITAADPVVHPLKVSVESVTLARGKIKTFPISHLQHDSIRGWSRRSRPCAAPRQRVSVRVCTEDYKVLDIPFNPRRTVYKEREAKTDCLPDTGAQVVIAGMQLVRELGLQYSDLVPVTTKLRAANKSEIEVAGGMLIEITMMGNDGKIHKAKELCYVGANCDKLTLSKETCDKLGMLTENFPKSEGTVGEVGAELVDRGSLLGKTRRAPTPAQGCDCPERRQTPEPPSMDTIDVKMIDRNREKLEDLIKEHYKHSAFNVCPHQELPVMTGDPLRIIVDPKVKPYAVHKPVPVPLHWRDKVREQLENDVRMGVIEPVPVGTPVTWCARMVVVPKHDGSPRRTVDLQALNRASVRQTHHTETPFMLASRVPKNTKKTCLDAFNGYHSVGLHTEDSHYTTFITQQGRYRYLRGPMGYLAAGDGYTHRYDIITGMLEVRKRGKWVKCVDDTLLWSENIKEAFRETCEFISHCGKHGVIFNPKKFHFAKDVAEFAGLEITESEVRPSKEYISAIRDFPTPTDISGARSWFGLVNQVAYTFCTQSVMEPFRSLLKTKGAKFEWTEGMEEAFKRSKDEIIAAVKKGVQMFDMKKKTCISTDWSKTGVGFILSQKHCSCEIITPTCCKEGWRLVLAGGRFTTPAEQNYKPIEGEALAVVYGLKKSKYFTLGCQDLLVTTDHKPLVKIMSDRHLEDIENPRIENLKEKTLSWRFGIQHVPGKLNAAADAISRHNSGVSDIEAVEVQEVRGIVDSMRGQEKNLRLGICMGLAERVADEEEVRESNDRERSVVAVVGRYQEEIPAVTWDRVKEATRRDPIMSELRNLIIAGIPEEKGEMAEYLSVYYQYREHLSVVEGVVIYKDRLVIPTALRGEVLEALHSAHQGVTGMQLRAGEAVFWPGMSSQLTTAREACGSCTESAPTQPSAPPTPLDPPEFPFQKQCADFANYGGINYLVMVDRYSGWLSLYKITGSKGLIKTLKEHFCTFGIPDELATDSGPEFTAGATKSFLRRWGTKHRLSSAYFPHSNCRAEVGVKSGKRLLRENTGPGGELHSDKLCRALLQYRNTPDRDLKQSPAQIVFGHEIKDFVPVLKCKYKPHENWRLTMEDRERALRHRHVTAQERLSVGTKKLQKLEVGDTVAIQNQHGNKPLRWDRTGTVIELGEFDKYLIRVDGSNRVTIRNRKFVRKISPFKVSMPAPRPTHTQLASTPPQGPASTLSQDRGGWPASRGSDLGKTRTAPTPGPAWGGGNPEVTDNDEAGEQLFNTPQPSVVIKDEAPEPAVASRPVRARKAPAHLDPAVYDLSQVGSGKEPEIFSWGWTIDLLNHVAKMMKKQALV